MPSFIFGFYRIHVKSRVWHWLQSCLAPPSLPPPSLPVFVCLFFFLSPFFVPAIQFMHTFHASIQWMVPPSFKPSIRRRRKEAWPSFCLPNTIEPAENNLDPKGRLCFTFTHACAQVGCLCVPLIVGDVTHRARTCVTWRFRAYVAYRLIPAGETKIVFDSSGYPLNYLLVSKREPGGCFPWKSRSRMPHLARSLVSIRWSWRSYLGNKQRMVRILTASQSSFGFK